MIQRFFSQAWLNAKVHQGGLNLTEFLAFKVGVSILTLVLYVLIARFTTGYVDLTAWVVGNAFALCVYECIFGIGGTFSSERFNGRLRSIIVAPTSKLTVIMYNGASSIVTGFLTIAVSFFIGGLLFGVQFSEFDFVMFALAIFAATFASVGLGLLLAVFALITDSIFLMLNALALLIIIFSGANFPVGQLPLFFPYIANIFPLYRSIAAARLSIGGAFSVEFWSLLLGEVLLGFVYLLITFLAIRIIERVATRNAALEMF
ncbi:MAG: ABC transporter permease [Oscillospiraceae bacterium]|nr:ABC transporter permease [Oscillospiraceae bacterium]MCL2277948.1 ABC transporter permease [Oscillospiraceae bacterium]